MYSYLATVKSNHHRPHHSMHQDNTRWESIFHCLSDCLEHAPSVHEEHVICTLSLMNGMSRLMVLAYKFTFNLNGFLFYVSSVLRLCLMPMITLHHWLFSVICHSSYLTNVTPCSATSVNFHLKHLQLCVDASSFLHQTKALNIL